MNINMTMNGEDRQNMHTGTFCAQKSSSSSSFYFVRKTSNTQQEFNNADRTAGQRHVLTAALK